MANLGKSNIEPQWTHKKVLQLWKNNLKKLIGLWDIDKTFQNGGHSISQDPVDWLASKHSEGLSAFWPQWRPKLKMVQNGGYSISQDPVDQLELKLHLVGTFWTYFTRSRGLRPSDLHRGRYGYWPIWANLTLNLNGPIKSAPTVKK